LSRFSSYFAAIYVRSTKASPQTVYGYTCVFYIPTEWGEFKGGNQQSGPAFQDRPARFVLSSTCPAIPRRNPRWKSAALR
jgi:hypothetical protein